VPALIDIQVGGPAADIHVVPCFFVTAFACLLSFMGRRRAAPELTHPLGGRTTHSVGGRTTHSVGLGALFRRRWWLLCAILVLASQAGAWSSTRIAQSAARRGDLAVQGVQALRLVMAAALSRDELGRVTAVNAFFNRRLSYRDDIDVWGEADYWASPLESLQRGMADCEDYAIAKYFTLTAMGVPHHKLRLVYMRAMRPSPGLSDATTGAALVLVEPHMVLAYYPTDEGDPLVLDNLEGEVRPANQRTDLRPVFSFNADGLWEGVGLVKVGGPGPAERMPRWRGALAKAHQDGFFR
jgi:predicted transglutaminase-like cysteine proteinase